ncbi:probable fatty acid desaturase [Crocosphaera subtropica ATCC 51142]|uniref:Probable fatty acid desaturase n=1 Tax=Crocosphaera subtropica (strain ATCC 51142 / BH68) TaxID=43989 RepID=B1WQ22_CROS5|nr:fatty acid desaturase [Crocosphaera subtropica]ACB53337.1 probable fatty acid desaturase [Crocosphaera subtropica ATCC 51142]
MTSSITELSTTLSKPKPRRLSEMPHTIVLAAHPLKKLRAFALVFMGLPFLGSLIAIVLASKLGIDGIDLGILLMMLIIAQIGIEVGYHRFFSHHAFKAKKSVAIFLGIAGSMAAQGTISYWISNHRRHHANTDHSLDPHSPYHYGDGFLNRLLGIWHSHIGWMFNSEATYMGRYGRDLLNNEIVTYVDSHYFKWIVLGVAFPALIGGLLHGNAYGVLTGFLWGGLFRIFLGQQLVYSVNSLCHLVGKRPFKTNDQSTNINVLSIVTCGGSLHNTHHAFPDTAINGLNWWQIDPGAWFIRSLEFMGLVWDVKLPSQAMMEAKRYC